MSILDWFLEPAPARAADAPAGSVPTPAAAPPTPVVAADAAPWTSAAVLGAPGAVEPMAAAVAAILRRRTRARAVIVARLREAGHLGAPREVPWDGDAEPVPGPGIGRDTLDGARGTPGDGPAAVSGSVEASRPHRGAAGRLAERLQAHGIPATARGRTALADLRDEGWPAAAHRAAACGAPLVLAVLRPRSPELDELLGAQDRLLLVTDAPTGPLTALAQAELGRLGPPVAVVAPLPAGPAGALLRAGRLLGRLDAALATAAPAGHA